MSVHRILARQSLRVRVTTTFVATAVALTLALTGTTFFTVRTLLERNRVNSSTRQTVFALLFARQFMESQGDRPRQMVSFLQSRGSFDAMVTAGEAWYSTTLSLTPSTVPTDLRALVSQERMGYQEIEDGGSRLLVFGAPLPSPGTDLYLFYPLDDIDRNLGLLARVLGIAGVAVIVAATLLAQRVSRRILRPLASVSVAAQRVAEGLLETRVKTFSTDEVGMLAASFNQMAAALQEMIERERRFVGAVSHELRTPLAALHTTSEFLSARRNQFSGEAREAVDLVHEDVGDLRQLVEELMEVSELDSKRAVVRWEKVDLKEFTGAILKRRHLDVPLSGPGITTYSDKSRLERIIGNLIDNAIHHGLGRDVRVSLGVTDGSCHVSVSDRGPGIPAEDMPHLFERFYKADRSRTRGRGGIGLGLAIARENARLLSGDIEPASAPGEGSTFTLRLPFRASPPEGAEE